MNRFPNPFASVRGGRLALAGACLLALAACHRSEPGATQVAAKVNGDEITIHQIDFAMRQRRNLRPDQADAASRAILEGLIDQQLEMQQAEKLKLDHNPEVVQTLEAIKRELLAREYLRSISENTPKPSEDDIKNYFASHPAMFAEHRTYTMQRFEVTAPPERRQEVVDKAAAAKSEAELADWLKAQNLKYMTAPMVLGGEQLVGPVGERLLALKEGQSFAEAGGPGAVVFTLQSVQASPKTLEQARPQIEQQLQAEAHRSAMANAAKDLRREAKIEYKGRFAEAPASAAGPNGPASAPAAAPGASQ